MKRLAVVLSVALVLGLAGVVAPFGAGAAPNQFVTMPDGIDIAVNVRLPDGYQPDRKYPTLFEMSGYDGGSAEDGTLSKDFADRMPDDRMKGAFPFQSDSRQLSRRFNDEYVTVHASVRGTGCSGGEFDLFSWQSALDGRHIIDQWIPQQPWSNGDVALMGHSYGGITGFLIAATQPRHLRAATLSGLIDDIYRGITYPGGVSNYGFPLVWTAGIRFFYDVGGGLAPGVVREEQADDTPGRRERCAKAAATKKRSALNEALVQGLSDTDSPWFQARSPINYAERIDVPMHITGAYQDEQTGPRGPTHLWEAVNGVPKRLLLTNGDHNTQNPTSAGPSVWADRKAWVDHWLRGVDGGFGTLAARRTSVRTLLETHRDATGTLVPNGVVDTTRFPLETTRWTEFYLGRAGHLGTVPVGTQPPDMYVSGSPRQAWSYQAGARSGSEVTTPSGPDELTYRSDPMDRAMTVVGPITANLFVSSTAPDTELFVQLIDEAPDGSRTYLQRGMLRASHRAVDPNLSDYDASGFLYRPHRPHSNADLVTPGQVYEYLIEVFPVGHVFRPGHRVVVKVHTPPAVDSYYVYVPKRVPGVNFVHYGPGRESRITLPVVPTPANLGPELACGRQEQVRCIPG